MTMTRQTETIEALVVQTIDADELDRYAIPSEISDAVEDGEELIVLNRDPQPEALRALFAIPVIGTLLDGLLSLLFAIPRAVGVDPDLFDPDAIHAVAPIGDVEEDAQVRAEISEAVVRSVFSRGQVSSSEALLYELRDVEELTEREN